MDRPATSEHAKELFTSNCQTHCIIHRLMFSNAVFVQQLPKKKKIRKEKIFIKNHLKKMIEYK